MKLVSKVIGSVNPATLCRSDGHLLFACGEDVIITGGENGQQIVFGKTKGRVNSLAASISEARVYLNFFETFNQEK